jgi:hypothetical protein
VTHNLGAIDPGRRKVFTVPRSAGPSVTLFAEGIDGTSMGSVAITLKSDSVVETEF